jgi:hypothetical protein
MKRVGNADTIADIEYVIDALAIGDSRHSWTAYGVDCTRDRHRFSSQSYEFNVEVLDLRHSKGRHDAWRVLIVTEWWRATDTKAEIRSTKWLKVLSGKASDVTAWMRSCRSLKTEKAVGAASRVSH